MQGTKFAKANLQDMRLLFTYLEFCLEQIVKDNELGALKLGLDGGYVEPGPGGDPIRNPKAGRAPARAPRLSRTRALASVGWSTRQSLQAQVWRSTASAAPPGPAAIRRHRPNTPHLALGRIFADTIAVGHPRHL